MHAYLISNCAKYCDLVYLNYNIKHWCRQFFPHTLVEEMLMKFAQSMSIKSDSIGCQQKRCRFKGVVVSKMFSLDVEHWYTCYWNNKPNLFWNIDTICLEWHNYNRHNMSRKLTRYSNKFSLEHFVVASNTRASAALVDLALVIPRCKIDQFSRSFLPAAIVYETCCHRLC